LYYNHVLDIESPLVKDSVRLGMTGRPAPSNVAAKPSLGVSPAALEVPERLEDPLAYLPCSTITGYAKGELIYGPSQLSSSIFLLIKGKVKVSRTGDGRRHAVVDIYVPDEFFGESGFLGQRQRVEEAVGLEAATEVMSWSTVQIEEEIARRPRLSIAMIQLMVRRSTDFGARIESLSIDNIPRRLVRSLIRFSERLGHESGGGFTDMMPFTHELLSQYVGTSREIITHYMNQLRREGYLRYSRQGIALNREALGEWLKRDDSAATESP
jgi:CRP/FNR family cyclic AMP-dependent transcriptional regulator